MRPAAVALFAVLGLSVADAHVVVTPRESQEGAEQRYTVRVPTEGQVATTSVELEIPPGVTVRDVVAGDGYGYQVRREGDRVVAITWTKDIPPKQSADFVFIARNPGAGEIAWKARQRFADGTSAEWVGPAGDRRPASVTRIAPIQR